jgi:hypothetical protein
MVKPRTHRRVSGNRKKSAVPLAKLRTAEVVRTVVNHPRRLQELANMLDDRHRTVRDRAATILARLSESHPESLIRILDRMKDALGDDSAYVRWHLVYCLGRIGSTYPRRSPLFVKELSVCLEDDNRIVRLLAGKAMARVAVRKPALVQELFATTKREMPATLARIFQKSAADPDK